MKLEPHPDGVLLPVKAQPGAKTNELRGVVDGALKVCVTQAPEKGKANKAIIQLLHKTLDLKRSQITLRSGETSSSKTFVVAAIELDELRSRIERALE